MVREIVEERLDGRLSRTLKEKFGPGSEFEKKMKALGNEMQKKTAEKHGAKEKLGSDPSTGAVS